MAVGEKEGKKPGREGEAEAWDRSRRWKKIGGDARREEGGERRKKSLFVRSGRVSGDHVIFF
jgi:hypothetical protein